MNHLLATLLLVALGAWASPVAGEPTELAATFVHGPGNAPLYLSSLRGLVDLVVQPGSQAATASFRLGLGDRLCRLAIALGPPPPAAGQPGGSATAIEVCLVAPDTDEAQFHTWARGEATAKDPALVVPLVVDPKSGLLVSRDPVTALLLLFSTALPRSGS